MKPTLFVLAAGMGSRYGGLKQLDGLGPNGETIMDYSIFDAIRAGFGKVVFVIRHSFAKEFLLDMSDAGAQVHFNAMRKIASEHPSEIVGEDIRKLYSWNDSGKLIDN